MERTHHFQDGRQSKGDVDLSGDAVVDDWTEDLLVKYNLESSRVHPMLVKAWAVDGETVCPSCGEQRPCEIEIGLLCFLSERSASAGAKSLSAEKENVDMGQGMWAPPSWVKTLKGQALPARGQGEWVGLVGKWWKLMWRADLSGLRVQTFLPVPLLPCKAYPNLYANNPSIPSIVVTFRCT